MSDPTRTAPRNLVILESPYAGDVERNTAYARRALADALARGEAPIASHLLYTQPGVLDDTDPTQRAQGIEAGLAWAPHAKATVVYTDHGITDGMLAGIDHANAQGRPVEYRLIGPEPPQPRPQTAPTAEQVLAAAQAMHIHFEARTRHRRPFYTPLTWDYLPAEHRAEFLDYARPVAAAVLATTTGEDHPQ